MFGLLMLSAAFVFPEEHMTTVYCVTVDVYCGGEAIDQQRYCRRKSLKEEGDLLRWCVPL